jgi:hypothetical protein
LPEYGALTDVAIDDEGTVAAVWTEQASSVLIAFRRDGEPQVLMMPDATVSIGFDQSSVAVVLSAGGVLRRVRGLPENAHLDTMAELSGAIGNAQQAMLSVDGGTAVAVGARGVAIWKDGALPETVPCECDGLQIYRFSRDALFLLRDSSGVRFILDARAQPSRMLFVPGAIVSPTVHVTGVVEP